MKESILTIWNEIKRGENIDQYLTIIVAFTLALLNLIGVAPTSAITPLILTVLGLLAVSSLVNRQHSEKLFDQLTRSTNNSLLKTVDSAGLQLYASSRENSDYVGMIKDTTKKLDCIGISLPDLTTDQCWKILRYQLSHNPDLIVRILLLNPKSIMVYKRRNLRFFKHKWKDLVNDIYRSISVFKAIQHERKELDITISDRYDVRVYSTIPTTSCVFNDLILNISFYDEVSPASISPMWIFKKNETEGNLYNHYQQNFDVIWQDAISIFNDDFETIIAENYEQELKILSDEV